MDDIQAYLNKLAAECGIDLIGIVDNNALKWYADTVSIANDEKIPFFNGTLHDRLILKNAWDRAESAISFAVAYNSSLNPKGLGGDRVKISKASYGEDYHNVLTNKADLLMRCFVRSYPCEYMIFADTGVLSDKALAYCAGLGFFGKNGLIINEKYGSYIFLGHILLNINIRGESEIKKSLCGECTKCTRACPHNAYNENNKYDYARCISYLNQSSQPYEATEYIYGCDICQEACPFNENTPLDVHEEFSCEKNVAFPLCGDILDMDKRTFKAVYGSCALAWRGIDNLKKNVANIQNRSCKEKNYV